MAGVRSRSAGLALSRGLNMSLSSSLICCLLAGCIKDNPGLLEADAARDARGLDATADARGDASADAMADASTDASTDAMPDAIDAIDALVDATPDAAVALPDARLPDAAAPDAAPPSDCPANRGGTSGIADPFGVGAACELLYICLAAPPDPDFTAAFLAAFPEGRCHAGDDCFDHLDRRICTCGAPAGGLCKAWVSEVDADEYRNACALADREPGSEIICGGDL